MRNSAENAETFPQPSVATAVKVCVFVFETNSETGLPSAYFLPSIRISSVYPLSSLTLTPTVSLPSMSAPLVMLPVMIGGVLSNIAVTEVLFPLAVTVNVCSPSSYFSVSTLARNVLPALFVRSLPDMSKTTSKHTGTFGVVPPSPVSALQPSPTETLLPE